MRIQGSVALVTGASSGIGAATAVELARRGATVVVTARREAELETTANRCQAHTAASFAITADLGVAGEGARVVATAAERLGRVDILVNNAGISLHRHALGTSAADVEHVMRINFLSAVQTTTAALPGMVERGRGSVVSITSVAGYIPNPNESAYGASKAALHLWSHGLGVDLHGTGVHVGVLSPGPIDTPIWELDETPSSYKGKKYAPEVVAAGVARMIEGEIAHATVPRRFGAVGPMYSLPLIGRAVRRGLIAFDRRGKADP
ncbi:MAG: SDR family NAD(P)-dependent oxidoreductase [Microthrixaceae bacterium]